MSAGSSPIIRRQRFTYGRPRRDQESSIDADAVADTSIVSNRSVAASSESGLDFPPSSDGIDASYRSMDVEEDEEHDDADKEASDKDDAYSRHRFQWQKELEDIDREYASDAGEDMSGAMALPDTEMDKGEAQSLSSKVLGTNVPTLSPLGDNYSIDDEDPFAAPSNFITNATHLVKHPSKSPVVARRGGKRSTTVLGDSDSEGDRAFRSSSHTSPSRLHHITTPKSRSSPTPPTSLEMAPSSKDKKEKQRPIAQLTFDEHASSSEDEKISTRTRAKAKGKAKIKRPTKKEVADTRKGNARIQAGREATIPKVQEKQLDLKGLWASLARGAQNQSKPEPEPDLATDPIDQYSSPHVVHTIPSRHSSVAPPVVINRARTPENRGFKPTGLLGTVNHDLLTAAASESDEFPEVQELIQDAERHQEQKQRAKALAELKAKALEQQQMLQVGASDEEDDLEVVDDDMHTVAKEEAEQRKRMKALHIKPSTGRITQLAYARRSSGGSHPKEAGLRDQEISFETLTAAAAPAFETQMKGEKKRGSRPVNERALNRLLLHGANTQNLEISRQKEEAWQSTGGKVMERSAGDVNVQEALRRRLQELTEKRTQMDEAGDQSDDEPQESGGSDEDWDPDMDAQMEDAGGEEGINEVESTGQGFVVHSSPSIRGVEDDEEDQENVRPPARHSRPRSSAVFDSDDDDENAPPRRSTARHGRVLVPDTSLVLGSSPEGPINTRSVNDSVSAEGLDEHMDEETDKENNEMLMFDQGEDKENTVVMPFPYSTRPRPLRNGGSLLGLERDPSLSSLGSDDHNPIASPTGAGPSQLDRAPFQEILPEEDDDPFRSQSPKLLCTPQGSPGFSPELSPLALRKTPSLRLTEGSDVPLPNLGNTPCLLQPAADIQSGGFTQLFDSASGFAAPPLAVPNPLKAGGFSQFMTPINMTPTKETSGLDALRKAENPTDLSLTLDGGLQPAPEVSEAVLRKADDIFEKEQEFLVEDAIRKPAIQSELFVNENGFYTQTRPDPSRSDPLSLGSPTSSSKFRSSPSLLHSTQRRPLGDIDLSDGLDLPEPSHHGGRLKKRRLSPELDDDDVFGAGGYRSSPSPSPAKPKLRNAFDVLQQRPKVIKKLGKSEFIEGEAEESDEEAMFGFGGFKKKDDEEDLDGEDLDKSLVELMDDRDMDDETLNEQKVFEKVKEHQEIDDAALEKLHRDAAEGKLRAKRRDQGIGFEDSDSEDDEDNARRRQKLANKKRKLDGDDSLEKLAKNEETLPFVQSYHAGTADDDADFAHLLNEDDTLFGNNDAEDEYENEDGPPETISAAELQEELRKVARGETTYKALDPKDVSWMDADEDMNDEDQHIRVKEISAMSKSRTSRDTNPNSADWDFGFPRSRGGDNLQGRSNLASWARTEGNPRNSGTGRASAVTGHTARTKNGGGSISGQRTGSSRSSGGSASNAPRQGPKLSKAPSALSAVSSRRDHFH